MDARGVIARARSLPGRVAASFRLRKRSRLFSRTGQMLRAKGRAVAQSGLGRRLRDRATGAVSRVGAAVGPKLDGAINREMVQELEAEVEGLRRRVEVLTEERDAERAARAVAEAQLVEIQGHPEKVRRTPRRRSVPSRQVASEPGEESKGGA